MEAEAGTTLRRPQPLFLDNVSQATKLLEKRREMYEAQDQLEIQRERYKKKEDDFKREEEKLVKKDQKLQQQLFKFNKFLQDATAKQRRAETRAAEEATQIQQKDEEIHDLESQLEQCKQTCAELDREVQRNMQYEAFLKQVTLASNDFPEIQDLVKRYETLEGSNKDLILEQRQSDSRIEELRNTFQNYRKEQEMEMMAFTNRIAGLKYDLEEVRKERQKLELHKDETTQESSTHSLRFGQIMMSVDNLFRRCTTKRKNVKHTEMMLLDEQGSKSQDSGEGSQNENEGSFRSKKDTAISQLNVIKEYIKDFKDITKKLPQPEKKHKKEAASTETTFPNIRVQVEASQTTGDRGSQNSGSQANTANVSQNISRSFQQN